MRYAQQIRPISYVKANAAEVLAALAVSQEPLIITQNGEARAVLQDIGAFEETEQALALLKLLAIGSNDIATGNTRPAREVVARLKAKAIAA